MPKGNRGGNKGGGGGGSKITMPQLEGSEKQVAWANDLRQKVVDEYMSFINGDETVMGVQKSSAMEVFRDAYEYGFTKAERYGRQTKYQEVYEQARKENPKAKVLELDDITDAMYVRKIHAEADSAYKKYSTKYKETKAQGNPDKSLIEKAKQAKAKVYKRETKKLLQRSVSNTKKAGDWIDTYKGKF